MEEAITLVVKKSQNVPNIDKKAVRDIVINNHLKVSTASEGKFMLKEAKNDERIDFTEPEQDLLRLFDDKLSHIRKQFKSMVIDFS